MKILFKIFTGFLTILLSLSFLSCEKENTKPFILVSPEGASIETYSNEKIVFYIDVYSDVALQKFLITKKYAGENEIVLVDSALFTKDFQYEWAFYTPSENEEDLLLYFNAIDINGEQSKEGKRLVFTGQKLDEVAGVRLYSAANPSKGALNFEEGISISTEADSTTRNIQEKQDDNTSTELSYNLYSPSGCQFVKFNDFDYANATSKSVQSAFNSGVKQTEIIGVKLYDIYLVQYLFEGQAKYGVLKLTSIYEDSESANDFYEFSIKR